VNLEILAREGTSRLRLRDENYNIVWWPGLADAGRN